MPNLASRPPLRLLLLVLVASASTLLIRPPHGAPAARGEARPADADASVPLFDGKTFAGWVTRDGKPPEKGWAVEDGCIVRAAHGGGDLFTAEEYGDFELSFEWRATAGVNSGVKYRVRDYPGAGRLGPEYQILDEPPGRPAPAPRSETGSLYALYETSAADRRLNPAGEWNHARVVARGTRIEHWLNGAKLLEADTATAEWSARLARSKFAKREGFGTGRGTIMLTDHAPTSKAAGAPDRIWFRNLTLRRL